MPPRVKMQSDAVRVLVDNAEMPLSASFAGLYSARYYDVNATSKYDSARGPGAHKFIFTAKI